MAGYNTIETARELTFGDVTQENAQKFIDHINNHFPNGWEKNDTVRVIVLDYQIKLENCNQSWASDFIGQLDASKDARGVLATSIRPHSRPSNLVNDSLKKGLLDTNTTPNFNYSWEVIERQTDLEYRGMFEYAQDTGLAIAWDRDLFIFQLYINQLNNGITIWIDGQLWSETMEAMQKDVFATQYFLQRMQAKGKDGEIIKVDWDFGENTRFAIMEEFGSWVSTMEINTEEITITPYVTSTFNSLNVSPEQAQELAKEIIGTPLNEIKIKKYQGFHNIWADGLIWPETYLELRASKVLPVLRADLDRNLDKPEVQKEVIFLLENANLAWRDMITVQFLTQSFLEAKKDDPNFEAKYWKLALALQVNQDKYAESDEWKTELKLAKDNSDTIYKMVKEGRWEDIIKDPTLLMIGWILFLFGVVWWDTKYTNSFIKRLWWIVWAWLFGKAAWNKLWIPEMIDDTAWYISSPEVQEKFNTAKTKTLSTLESIPGFISWLEIPDFDWGKVWEKYDEILEKFKTRQNTLVDDKGEKLITDESFVALHTTLFNDEKFLNTSKQDVAKITNRVELLNFLSPSNQDKFNEEFKDSEIQAFIQNFIVDEMWDSNEFVYQIFLSSQIIDAANDAVAVNLTNFNISNQEQNTIVQQWFANILNISTSSEALKDATKKLARDTQKWDVSAFSVDSFPSITDEAEKDKITKLSNTIKHIFATQDSIKQSITQVNEVQLAPNGLVETRETLDDKLIIIDEIKKESDNLKVRLWDEEENIDTNTFDWESLETAYKNKRIEIFQMAQSEWIVELQENNLNVQEVLWETELESILENSENEINIIDQKFKTVLWDSTTLEQFKTFTDNYPTDFNRLEEIKAELLNKWLEEDHEIIIKIVSLLDQWSEFNKKYDTLKRNLNTKINTIKDNVPDIDKIKINASNYSVIRIELEKLMEEAQEIQKELTPWYTFDAQMLYKKYILWEYVAPTSDNLIDILDREIDRSSVKLENITDLHAEITAQGINLETKYELNLNLDSLDVTDLATMTRKVENLKQQKSIIEWFANPEIRDRKIQEIARAYQLIQTKYVNSINEASTEEKLNNLLNGYTTIIEDEVSAVRWQWFSETIKSMFSEDPVKSAYEEKISEILNKEINTAPFEKNSSNPNAQIIYWMVESYFESEEFKNNELIKSKWGIIQKADMNIKQLVENLWKYVQEDSPLYLQDETNRAIISTLIEKIKEQINELI